MALTYDQLTAITRRKFIPKLVDNIFDSDPLLQRLKKGETKLDGGTKIIQPLAYAQATASDWYAGSDTLDTSDNEVITAAEYDWKQIYGSITISRADELKNSGDSQVLSLVKNKTKIVEKTLTDKMQDGIYSNGSNAKAISGLRVMVSTSNTVGGIDQSLFSFWQGQVDSTTPTLTISALQTMWTNLTIDNEVPTVVMGTRTNYNRYYALLQPQQRFMDTETAKGGFQSLMFNGAPFIPGSKVPSGYVYMLNESYLHLNVHKDEDFRMEPFQKPINQNVKVAKIFWMGAFTASNNRQQGVLTALTA